MNLPSPLKSGLGAFIGAALLFVYWTMFPKATAALVMAMVAFLWGILWMVLQHRANTNTKKEMKTATYQPSVKEKMIALSRARHGFKQGWLVTDRVQLFFYEGTLETSPGKSFNSDDTLLTPVLLIEKIESFKHSAGLWGGGTLEFFTDDGLHKTFHIKDPEGLPLIINMLESD